MWLKFKRLLLGIRSDDDVMAFSAKFVFSSMANEVLGLLFPFMRVE